MNRIPTIKSVMTPFPYSVEIDEPVSVARELMDSHQIRHLPVTLEQELIGIVTDRDIKLLAGSNDASSSQQNLSVADVYTSNPVIVDFDERLDNVVMKMVELHVDSVLVTRKAKLAGIFTATDACRYLVEHLREHFSPPGGDEAA